MTCRAVKAVVVWLVCGGLASPARAQSPGEVANTAHNLSVTGTGTIRALTETRICVFCHTPHNAAPQSPLWNKDLEPRAYTVYTSPTLQAGPLPQPTGPTKLCLSCHDGTIAIGAVLNPAEGIDMTAGGTLSGASLANFGLDLSGHHPVSFPYGAAQPNSELAPSPPADLRFGGVDEVHCTTCHDPHDDAYGKFLSKDNRFSELCITCHEIPDWSGSAHATSTASVVGVLPRPPKTFPQYTQLNEWGCEVCHTPHFAPTAEHLLNFTDAPPDPFSCLSGGCHTSDMPPPPTGHGSTAIPETGIVVDAAALAQRTDIAAQTRKISAHRPAPASSRPALRRAGVVVRSDVHTVTCADCHDPHGTRGWRAEAPFASGLLQGVSGVDRNGAHIHPARYEYEVCFRCHADDTPDLDYVPRVRAMTNTRLAFDPTNPSHHPVVANGRNPNVPSIPSSFEPRMSPAEVIYCTSCHADDEGGSRGPHGSSFPPILRERYETVDNTPESYDNYALCYRCHERTTILRDVSFRKKTIRTSASGGGHSGHLAAGAPCSACHDPHGVSELVPAGAAGPTGSHTHLINFDTRVVLPKTGSANPVFADTGTFSGSCDLVCHGVVHDAASYP